jgi:hypothetical protein
LTLRLFAAALLVVGASTVVALASPAQAAGPNLAAGKPATASSTNASFAASNITDGNQDSYWESTNGTFPQWAQVDLGSTTSVNQVVLKLPASWGTRTETLSVQGSTDGSSFSTIVASAGQAFPSGNVITLNFGATNTRFVRVNVTANNGWPAAQLSELEVYGPTATSSNLALGKTMSASGVSQTYAASNANDGNQSTYWESTNSAFPQWLQVDLGSSVGVNKVVLKLPATWGARNETLAVQGSTTGSSFSDLVASQGYNFDPASGNTVTITFNATTTRYLRLNIAGNTGWPAGQISEFEVYGPTGGDPSPPTAPTNLAFSEPTSGQIKLTWNASTDNVGVTGYDIYANGTLINSVGSTVLTYTDTQALTATVTYFVRAHDAAGNQSPNSNSVTRTGQTGGDNQAPTAPGNLTLSAPASGQIKLTWTASSDNVGVTGYDIFRNGTQATSVGNVLTFTDTQPDTATVSYFVEAHDAAGNESPASNTATRTGSGGGGSNLAVGKPITGTANAFTFVPTNANDGDVTTYFEGSTYPSQVTVKLGANADVTSVVVKLNPDPAWGARTQTIQVLGREQSATTFTSISAAQLYSFNPTTGNTVTIPVTARVADVELSITTNSGAPGGQVAEFQVIGTPAPNPDLTVTSSSWTPTSPVETDTITASATVHNGGTAAAGATNVNFYLDTTKVGTASVPALAAGASATVSASIGTQSAATYQFTTKVDEANTVIETNDANNSYTNPTPLVVGRVPSSDLVASSVAWTPSTPQGGSTVSFTVTVLNQGTLPTTSGAHAVTVTVLDTNNATVKTLTGSFTGPLAAGASTVVNMGTWVAANGKYTVRTVLAVDGNELSVKQANNTSTQPLFVGQGANMPYDMYEAESGTVAGGATVVGPNRTIGDFAGEASGRKAVTLSATNASVSWTSRVATNTFVVRYAIPDSAGGGGTNATLDLYINGNLVQPLSLTSHFAWLYGAETGPGNSPSAGSPRHIYDESSFLLPASYPIGSTIKLQKDSANSAQYYAIDYMQLEQTAPTANPDPAHYAVPTGFATQDVQNALDKVRTDTTGTWTGVYLPAGQYALGGQKLLVYQKPVKVVGAGVWYTQFVAPTTMENTDADWDLQTGASGSSFSGFAWFGNYDSRIDGPGHTWDLRNQSNITIDNVWIEHQVVGVWGAANVQNSTFTNMRIRDTYADGINLTNGSQGNLISNDEARATGDDSFALFAAQDQNAGELKNNTIQNVTALFPWRAAGMAIYGGYANTIQNFVVADTLTYSGLTISSLNFGFAFEGFGASPPTTIQNFSLPRDGGHFWGGQVFGAIWVFSATNVFQGIRVNDATITDPTYSGIMFQTDYVGGTALFPVKDTIFTRTTITGAHHSGDAFDAKSGYGIWANPLPEAGQGPAVGTAVFNTLTESNNDVDIQNTTTTFTITVNP